MMTSVNQNVWDEKEFLIYCAETYPKAQAQDFVKRLYQSEFGGGHMITDEASSLARIQEELFGLTEEQKSRPYFEPYCGAFCRMNLSMGQRISPELINRIFVESSKGVGKGSRVRFEEKLRLLREVCEEQNELFAFTPQELDAYIKEYEAAGYPPVSQSPEYQQAYTPAYRVVRKEFARYLEIYEAMEHCLSEKGRANVAIDGNSGAGKTEAARVIASVFDCNVFHTDDFFLPAEKRTPERLAEVGGNMDRERFRQEVCEKVRTGQPFSYREYDCDAMALRKTIEVEPKAVNLFEGSYSMHPDLREYYDVSAFFSIPLNEQEARILARNGGFMLRRFLEEWIPKENAYFDQMQVKEACDIVL